GSSAPAREGTRPYRHASPGPRTTDCPSRRRLPKLPPFDVEDFIPAAALKDGQRIHVYGCPATYLWSFGKHYLESLAHRAAICSLDEELRAILPLQPGQRGRSGPQYAVWFARGTQRRHQLTSVGHRSFTRSCPHDGVDQRDGRWIFHPAAERD